VYTREEFEAMRIAKAGEMAQDNKLQKEALDVLVKADHYNWIHQTTWFGEPILNLPQDMFAFQEIIFNTRPDYIIEIGVAWAGSLLFYSTLMDIVGGKEIIGIDVYIPDDLIDRIRKKGKISDRINWISGSSIDQNIVERVKSIIGDNKNVFVVLDSNHSREHVSKELEIYSHFVGKGNYIVCGDTIIEDLPENVHGSRTWGKGNNPKAALTDFLTKTSRFEIDRQIENKLLFSCNPGGYLKCVKD